MRSVDFFPQITIVVYNIIICRILNQNNIYNVDFTICQNQSSVQHIIVYYNTIITYTIYILIINTSVH